jgi:ketopantoate reductase
MEQRIGIIGAGAIGCVVGVLLDGAIARHLNLSSMDRIVWLSHKRTASR